MLEFVVYEFNAQRCWIGLVVNPVELFRDEVGECLCIVGVAYPVLCALVTLRKFVDKFGVVLFQAMLHEQNMSQVVGKVQVLPRCVGDNSHVANVHGYLCDDIDSKTLCSLECQFVDAADAKVSCVPACPFKMLSDFMKQVIFVCH